MSEKKFNDDVDRRIERLLKSQEEGFKELRESQKELRKSQKKTDEQIRETNERQKKTDEQIKDLEKLIKRLTAKTDAEIEKTLKMVADITDSWGDYTEGIALPPVRKEFVRLGFTLEDDRICVEKTLNGKKEEMDILLLGSKNGSKVVFACEVKTTLNRKKVDKVIEDLDNFFLFFPEYRDRELIGSIVAVKARKESIEYAKKKGLYVFRPSGETMELINPEDKPMILRYTPLPHK